MLIHHPGAQRAPYPDTLRDILNIEAARQSHAWLKQWPLIAPGATPCRPLPDLARQLGIASLSVKDESCRSALGSFKALGAPIALVRLVLRLFPAAGFSAGALFRGDHAAALRDFTVISATDGNHGRALAAAARSIGCRCVIVIHRQVSDERRLAIEQFGAQVLRIEGGYDDSVQEAARLAAANRWHVVSDTSYEGYETIPRDVMQGYGVIAAEAIAQQCNDAANEAPWSHVFIQGGVGGLAAGIVSYMVEYFGERRPAFVMVEPVQADCLYQSALRGMAAHALGSVDSVMAGLACGDTSPLAWRFLAQSIDFFMTVDDAEAVDAMRLLATGTGRDVPIVAGESGAAGLAGLIAIARDAASRVLTGIDSNARVLVINTEGATAPALYRRLTGRSDADVLIAQQQWDAAHAG